MKRTFATDDEAELLSSSPTVIWHSHAIDRQAREQLNGHKGILLWFTGLSGAGKSTIAGALEQRLHAAGIHTFLLDGDNVRHGLCRDLGFSEIDRQENLRRVGEVAHLMVEAGLVVLSAFVSPYQADRAQVRERVGSARFYEIFVDAPLHVCEARDPKGLYQQARKGLLLDFTGIDAPYEPPSAPDVHLLSTQPLSELVDQLILQLTPALQLSTAP